MDKNSKTTHTFSSCEPEEVIPDILPEQNEPGVGQKIKGTAQMMAGGAIAAAGVPMLVLPGPGVAFIAGGTALACKGHRAYTGRKPTFAEEKLDAVAEKASDAAKAVTKKAARDAAAAAPEMAHKAIKEAPVVLGKVASSAGKVAVAGATKAVHLGSKLADKGIQAIREKQSN